VKVVVEAVAWFALLAARLGGLPANGAADGSAWKTPAQSTLV